MNKLSLLLIISFVMSCGSSGVNSSVTATQVEITPTQIEYDNEFIFQTGNENATFVFQEAFNNIPIYFEQGNDLLNNNKDEFITLIKHAIEQNSSYLYLDDFRVIIDSSEFWLSTDWVAGGNVFSDRTLHIAIGTDLTVDKDQEQFFYIFAHELHHMMRMNSQGNIHETLLSTMVAEGLADHYARQITSADKAPWSVALDNHDKALLISQALVTIKSGSYNSDVWMHGAGEHPVWTGYTLGYDIIDRYLRDYIGSTAANLVSMPYLNFSSYIEETSPSDKKLSVSVRTPDLVPDIWDQVPVAEFNRQALLFPKHYFLEGFNHTKKIALTFDDGPSFYTQGALDVLANRHVKATFFMMGQRIEEMPEQAKAVFNAGHEIANHSWDHTDSSLYQDNIQLWQDQVERTNQLFLDVFGYKSRFFRPPYGRITDKQVSYLANRGTKTILWSIDSRDWNPEINTVNFISQAVINNAHHEAIVLMHDAGGDRSNTILALDEIISHYLELGYQFVTISELLGIGNKY
ncbi:MAG: polysaccharide deacetylase family protein [Colwellia sp.]|nr:polysaccharide deacetylase family protein [Colwellia sp.]